MQANDRLLSCDWGTTAFRLRLIDTTDFRTVAEDKSGQGIADTFARWKSSGQEAASRWDFYLRSVKESIRVLEEKVHAPLAGLPVVISGMASSTVGMIDLPYKELPFRADGSDLNVHTMEATAAFPHPLCIISGARTPVDVMRGEETKLAGCTPTGTAEEALFIFPGTHSKHVQVKEGRAIHFSTYMTGEFFALLSGKSILSASVEEGEGWNREANRSSFEKGVLDSTTFNILNSSFLVRTNDVFGKLARQENYHYLSGLLVGTELGYLKNSTAAIMLAGSTSFRPYYMAALQVLQASQHLSWIDADEALVRGQFRVYRAVV